MIKKTYEITNESGIHARPATTLVGTTDKFKCDVTLVHDGKNIDFKSIIGVLSLGISRGQIISLIYDGEDENEAAQIIGDLFLEFNIGKEI